MSSHFYKTTSSRAAILKLMPLNPCINLSFNGQCEEAFKFYERCLGGKISFMLAWGDSPMAKDAPPEWSGKIAHATLLLGDTRLQGSDPAPGAYQAPRGFGITISPDESDADLMFAQLSESGTIILPLEKTFWAARFGMVTDRFGIPWLINCEKSE